MGTGMMVLSMEERGGRRESKDVERLWLLDGERREELLLLSLGIDRYWVDIVESRQFCKNWKH